MLRDYYQALKPERTYANVMTTLAGFLFACSWRVDWTLLAYTLAGTTLIVMSACAVNNVTDRELDTRMPRTRKRATATGQVSARNLLAIAVLFGAVGFTLLAIKVNVLTAMLGVLGYVDYVLLYAWSKRTTPYSTLVGTISGAVPLVAGYAAATGQLDTTALLLGLIMLAWQMPHFYAIGIFRLKDYRAGGLPIWPVVHGVRNTQVWIMVYTALYVLGVLGLSWFGHAGWVFGVSIGGLGLYWLLRGFKGFAALRPEKWARGMFGFSLVTLLALSVMLTLAPLLP